MADDFGIDDYRAHPLRRGVLAHCYRLLGSIQEAEHLTDQTITQYYATPAPPESALTPHDEPPAPTRTPYDATPALAANPYDEPPARSRTPYDATPTRDPYDGTPARDPYDGTPTGDPYDGTPTGDPYDGTPTGDPYDATPTRDPYGERPALARSPYDGVPEITESALRRLTGEATLACLADAGIRAARPLPTALAGPNHHPEGELAERPEVLWLEPIPDDLVDGSPLGLEHVAALQLLPPRARAALILSDEGWSTDETSALLNADAAQLLQEARSQFNPAPPHTGTDRPDLLDCYSFAFETYDVPAIVELFAPDAIWEMPPFISWFRGAKNIGKLISTHCPAKAPGDQLLVPLWANGQPGFAVYMRDENVHRAFQIQVLTLTAAGIIHAVAFFDVSLFDAFHLPDLFTQLPENAFEHRPRLHFERIRHTHGE